MNDLTQERIHLALIEIRRRRLSGEIPDRGRVSAKLVARVSEELEQPVSPQSFLRHERMVLAKVSARLGPEILTALRSQS